MAENWLELLSQSLGDPDLDVERAHGMSGTQWIAEKLAATKFNAAEHDAAEKAISKLINKSDPGSVLWNNLPQVVALARFQAPSVTPTIRKLLREADASHVNKRSSLVDLLVEFGYVFHPNDIDEIGDLAETSPNTWLDAATSIQKSDWLRKIFMDAMPRMVSKGKLSGLSVAARLDYWLGCMPSQRDLIVDAVRKCIREAPSDEEASMLVYWLRVHYPEQGLETGARNKKSNAVVIKERMAEMIEFFRPVRQRIAA